MGFSCPIMWESPLTESDTLGRGLEWDETVSMLDDALDYVSREGVRFPERFMTTMASITFRWDTNGYTSAQGI